MLRSGILNPNLLSLIARVRHTTTIVIADRGFPFWPGLETIDLSLVDGVPTVIQVLSALREQAHFGEACMAREFISANDEETRARFSKALDGIALLYEPHIEFKKRVPQAIGLVRTGDTTQYANMMLVSA
jgi:D-ribose pyranase